MRTICYCETGQSHAEHFDAHFCYPKGKYPEGHPWAQARSFFTLFLYSFPTSGKKHLYTNNGTLAF